MSLNSFGHLFRVTTWGESHGPALGCVVDGCPPGDRARPRPTIQPWLDARRPGPEPLHHPAPGGRPGRDPVRHLRGHDHRHADLAPDPQHRPALEGLLARSRATFRPGHADLTYHLKYGIRDYRGGGRSSARETAARVAAGGVARAALAALLPQVAHPRRAGADGRPPDRPRRLGLGRGAAQPVLVPGPGGRRRLGRLPRRLAQVRQLGRRGDRARRRRRAGRPRRAGLRQARQRPRRWR